MPDSQDDLHPKAPGGITRRDFNRRAARTAASVLLATTVASRAAETTPDPALATPDGGVEPAAPRPAGLMEAVARVRSAAPALPEGDIEELERQVKSALDLSRTLGEAPLSDGMEPGFVFRALTPSRKAHP